jgi:hypothetical protein
MKKFFILFLVAASIGLCVLTRTSGASDTISHRQLENCFSNTRIKVNYRDNNYTHIPEYWFRNRGIPFVAKFFVDNNIKYVPEAMDCENLSDLFIALLNAKYIADNQDRDGKFTKAHEQLLIGHIVTVNKKTRDRHDAVILEMNGQWRIIEPIFFLNTVTNDPTKHATAFDTFDNILKTNIVEAVEF